MSKNNKLTLFISRTFILGLFVLSPAILSAQSRSLQILEENPDARSIAMGNVSLMSTDRNYLYVNPSSIFYNENKYSANINGTFFPKNNDVSGNLLYGNASAAFRFAKRHAAFIGYRYLGGQTISVNPTTNQSVQYAPAVPAITSKFNIVVGDILDVSQEQSEVLLDLSVSGYPSIAPGSSSVVQLTPSESTYDLVFGKVEFNVIKRFTIPSYTSLTSPNPDIYTYFINNIVGNYDVEISNADADLITAGDNHSFKGSAVINVSLDAVNYGTTQISFIVKFVSVTLESYEGVDGTTGEPIPFSEFISFSLNQNLLNTSYVTTWTSFRAFRNYNSRQYVVATNRSFKSGQRHKFGIVYYDLFNRSGAVNEIGEKEVSFIASRSGAANGPVALQFKLLHSAPSWAKKWQLVYSPFSSYTYSLQHSVSEALTNTTDSFIYVSMNTLEGKVYSYKDSKDTKIDYSFVEGDKLKTISYNNGTGRVFVEHEFDILAYEYYDANNTPISSSINPDRKTGWFLKKM